MIALVLAFGLAVANGISVVPRPMRLKEDDDTLLGSRIPLDIFVMSRCPDALRCEARINEVLKRVENITKVRPNFIASTEDYRVTCKHGDVECAGDIQQLCMYRYASQPAFWKFFMCQNEEPSSIGQLSLAEHCLGQISSEYISEEAAGRARQCWSSHEGKERLRESADFTWSEGVTKSCTIWIDDRPRCVHDGGVWYNCPGGPEVEDLVGTICTAYWSRTGAWAEECTDSRVKMEAMAEKAL